MTLIRAKPRQRALSIQMSFAVHLLLQLRTYAFVAHRHFNVLALYLV